MTTNEEHLSMFELDLYFATQARDPRIEEHVAACERCSAYLAELTALQQSAPVTKAPRTSRAPARRASGLTLAAGLAVLVAVTALLVLSRDASPPAVAVKGSPSVQLLVRRGDATRPWDGVSPVSPGDVLALRVACEEFGQVAVLTASGQSPQHWSQPFQGACPEPGAALPFTLLVDEAPGSEVVAVVFSASSLDARALEDAIERRRADAVARVVRLELEKEVSR